MVYGVLRLINFAHGDVSWSARIVGYYRHVPGDAAPAQPSLRQRRRRHARLAMVVCALLGFLIERLAYRPLRNAPRSTLADHRDRRLAPARVRRPARLRPGPEVLPVASLRRRRSIHIGGVRHRRTSSSSCSSSPSLFMALPAATSCYSTQYGRAMRAVSFNLDAASLMGIPTDRIISIDVRRSARRSPRPRACSYGLLVSEDRSADGHHARPQGVRRRGARRHRQRPRRGGRRPR